MDLRIPKEYQEVEYIESTGTQYIDTGLKGAAGYIVDVKCLVTSSDISDQTIIGSSFPVYLGFNFNAGYMGLYFNYSGNIWVDIKNVAEVNKLYNLTVAMLNGNQYVISDGKVLHSATETGNISNGYNITVFARNTNGNISSYCKIKLYALSIKNSDEVSIRYFVPCYRKSDGVAGLYDIVSNTFFTNSGTGTFMLGADVNTLPDRKFQDGIVGSTNIVEGMKFGNPYEQLVNYTALYYKGDENMDVTGGWVGAPYQTAYGSASGTWTKNETNLHCVSGGSGSLVSAGFTTQNKINLSQYKQLVYNIVEFYKGWAITFLANPDGRTDHADYRYEPESLSLGLLTWDVSGRNHDAYVGFGCWAYASTIAVDAVLATKADDWQTLCSKAGVTATSLNSLLANVTSLTAILTVKDAVNFMTAQCTGEFMFSAIQSSTFITALNNSPYKAVVQANEHWAKFLAMVA